MTTATARRPQPADLRDLATGIETPEIRTLRHRPGSSRAARRLKLYGIDPRCWYCGHAMPFSESTIDHLQARAKGGTDRLGNVALSCQWCNQCKGKRSPEQWASDILAAAAAARSLGNGGAE